jgi:hypothetical protein
VGGESFDWQFVVCDVAVLISIMLHIAKYFAFEAAWSVDGWMLLVEM